MSVLAPAVRLLLEADAVVVDRRDHAAQAAAAALPRGAQVVLTDDRPGSRGRLRRRVQRLGLSIEREYVVLPSARRAAFIVEDHPTTLTWLWRNLATVPPGVARTSLVVDALVLLVARAHLVGRLGALAPGRVVVARRQ